MNPSLRARFVPLAGADIVLTDEQLDVVFGGDLSALQDATLDKIAAMSLEAFWQQESRYTTRCCTGSWGSVVW